MKIEDLILKIKRKWMKIRLHPIRVFCFHHVSEEYDPTIMWDEDWTNVNDVKHFIEGMQKEGYIFIPLADAYKHIKQDKVRVKKYAVLTTDDGYRSLLNILPWLLEHNIPITIFVNPKYILEDSIGVDTQRRLDMTNSEKSSEEIYLKLKDVNNIQSSLITYGYHGYEHLDEWNVDENQFAQNVEKCLQAMDGVFPNVIPFYAHTYGHVKPKNDLTLIKHGLIPVYIAGNGNIDDSKHIDRELLSNARMKLYKK